MKKEDIVLLVAIIMSCSMVVLFTTVISNKLEYQIQKNDVLQSRIDSLNEAVIESQIDNGRYQIIIDRIWEKDSNIVINATKNLE